MKMLCAAIKAVVIYEVISVAHILCVYKISEQLFIFEPSITRLSSEGRPQKCMMPTSLLVCHLFPCFLKNPVYFIALLLN